MSSSHQFISIKRKSTPTTQKQILAKNDEERKEKLLKRMIPDGNTTVEIRSGFDKPTKKQKSKQPTQPTESVQPIIEAIIPPTEPVQPIVENIDRTGLPVKDVPYSLRDKLFESASAGLFVSCGVVFEPKSGSNGKYWMYVE